MEFEPWWLTVIPLFFGLGWLASRIDSRHLIRQSSQLPDAYFKGLNFLLNEQPDKAIDAFVDVVKLDPETIELHFALGNLFRRRGETDRAIRVHQSLVTRGDVAPAQREHALFELGQDFLRAGLLDRAEDAFNRLEGTSYAGAALRHRLDLAQMVRDWPRAIELAQRLQRGDGGDQRPLIAHFHCELAQQALAATGPDRDDGQARARREIELALQAGAAHPRPWLLRGEAAFAAESFGAAIDAWSELARISPAHLALTGEHWLQAHERLGRLADGLAALEAVQREHPSVDALRAIAQARARRDGAPAAIDWLRGELAANPSLLGLEQLLELRRSAGGEPGEGAADTALTAALIQRQAARLSRFVCSRCGFKARRFYWQCPGCNHWDSYPPRRTEALEAEGG
jgi:lipopolysaccharide biosynthesis regulator YciM